MIADGFLVVDKEGAMTSHDVVAIARKSLNLRRVGHAGTLDPMATGVLVLGFGIGTKLLHYITHGDKSYTATIKLGQSTSTDDADGDITFQGDTSAITEEAIEDALAQMRGVVWQKPSSVSAIRIDGERAYDLVREGKAVDIPERQVTISRLHIDAIRRYDSIIEVDIDVTCSAGTYIRSIARDLGSALGVGGHLIVLRRTRVGRFTLEDAISVRDLKERSFHPLTITEVAMKFFPVRFLSSFEEKELGYGRPIHESLDQGVVAAISQEKNLVALIENREGSAKPVTVFAAIS